MNTPTREEAIEILRQKNEAIKAILDRIVVNAEKGTTSEILEEVRRLAELENAMKPLFLPFVLPVRR